ncbi:MAG: hypothetical protein J7647_14095 [Cyanobacteria bacterium SBLK]|nr:hypothetical protein [Cyanobacteria bacterium SBLK]
MNLSTSSSKKTKGWGRLISFRPFIACFLLLGLYQILIFGGVISPSNGINQWQNNAIKGQRYWYDRTDNTQLVMVGSSLIANIPAKSIGKNVVNLGMAGGCTQTGLEIVAHSKQTPNIVLAEINDTLERQRDRDLLASLNHPLLSPLRRYFSMFREEYKPISVFVSLLRGDTQEEDIEGTNIEIEEDLDISSELREQEIERLVGENNISLPHNLKSLLKQEASQIEKQVNALEKKGIRVILVDIPRETKVAKTPRQQEVKSLMKSLFPPSRYDWFEPPVEQWKTSDGLHLIPKEVNRYALLLRQYLF